MERKQINMMKNSVQLTSF